jgi:hypothetical protein
MPLNYGLLEEKRTVDSTQKPETPSKAYDEFFSSQNKYNPDKDPMVKDLRKKLVSNLLR